MSRSSMSFSKHSGKGKGVNATHEEETEKKIQMGLELMHKFGTFLKVETATFTFHPENLECDKLFASYLKKQKYTPTYSNYKTLICMGGRFLYSAICNEINLEPTFNATGCSLWEHGWSNSAIKCLHGSNMIKKVNEIEMSNTSEAGITALKDGRGTLCSNRWGRQCVKITQENFIMCAEDINQRFGQKSAKSCGMSFSDSEKAKIALMNAKLFTKYIFPSAKMDKKFFIPVHCDCNSQGKIILGNQLPKMTPFNVGGAEDLNPEDVNSAQAITVKYPVVMVFQCCNVTGAKKDSSCQFKISSSDLTAMLSLCRKLWISVTGNSMAIVFPNFVWDNKFRVQSALLPEAEINSDLNPFGEEEESDGEEVPDTPPPVPKKKRRQVVTPVKKTKTARKSILEESSEEDEESQ